MQLATRQVGEGDRQAFEQLHADYINEGETQEKTAPAGWLDNIYGQALTGQRYLWLAQVGGQNIGFCSFRIVPFFSGSSEKFADIQDFYVVPSMRGRGFGRQLAGIVLQEAMEERVVSIELDVSADNSGAMQFWKSVGFKLRVYAMEMPVPQRPA